MIASAPPASPTLVVIGLAGSAHALIVLSVDGAPAGEWENDGWAIFQGAEIDGSDLAEIDGSGLPGCDSEGTEDARSVVGAGGSEGSDRDVDLAVCMDHHLQRVGRGRTGCRNPLVRDNHALVCRIVGREHAAARCCCGAIEILHQG